MYSGFNTAIAVYIIVLKTCRHTLIDPFHAVILLCDKAQVRLVIMRPAPHQTRAQHNKHMTATQGNDDNDENWNSNIVTEYRTTHKKKKRCKPLFGAPPAKKKKPSVKVMTRNHIRNDRKLQLLKQFDNLAANHLTKIEALTALHDANPALPVAL